METETRLIVTCCHQFVVGFVVIDPVIVVKFTFHPLCCPVCDAEPGNWSDLQQYLAEHLCDVFKNGVGDASMEQAQVRGGAEGGSEREVLRRLVEVLATLSSVNAAELRELTAIVFKTYLVPCAEPVAVAMAEAGRFYHETTGAIKDRPETETAEAHEQLGPPFVHVWVAFLRSLMATKRVGARACGDGENSLGGQRGEELPNTAGGLDAHRVLPRLNNAPARASTGSSTVVAEREPGSTARHREDPSRAKHRNH